MNVKPPSTCPEFGHYLEAFRERFQKAVEENKWYLSEQRGQDVGEQAATRDFLQNHFDRFAEEVRAHFCEHECRRQKNCPLALFIRSLPPSALALNEHRARLAKQAAGGCKTAGSEQPS